MGDREFFDEVYRRYGVPAEFIESLKHKLKTHRISKKKLAARAGYHRSHLSRWLNGHVRPGMDVMVVLDEALHDLIEEKQ